MINYYLKLKDLDIADFHYNINDYYKECFSILKTADYIIQNIFHNHKYRYNFKHFNDKRYGIILYNIVKDRLIYEHCTDEKILNQILTLDYDKCEICITESPQDLRQMIHYANYGDNRCTGRTTRLKDTYINEAYKCINEYVIVHDHYGDAMRGMYRGMHTVSCTASDRLLFQSMIKRLERELPKPIYDSFKFDIGQATMCLKIQLPRNFRINYKLID